MYLKSLVSKRTSVILFTLSIVATFSFAACSGKSKKQNKAKNQTVNKTQTTPQQTTETEQQKATTGNQTKEAQSAQTKTTESNATNAKAISAERGYNLIQNNGCLACHSTNGQRMAGPTFKNLYGRKTTLRNGKTITADEAYLKESIKDPKAKVVEGFSPVMPRFSYLKNDQIASIIAYFKSISK